MIFFSFRRLWSIITKEFIQMKRDRVTFGMIVSIPLMQLILFGFAINFDPKDLPTVVVSADESYFTRQIILALQNSKYFKILPTLTDSEQADKMLATNQAQFALHIPQNFSQRLIRNQHPSILVEVDASDPATTSFATNVVQNLNQALKKHFTGSLSYLQTNEPPINFIIQAKYNPERITQYNIIPGLLGVVLTMTMVLITSIAITRERERGTMESLLAMPVRPLEVVLGKLIPYIFVGYVQVFLIILAAYYIFSLPIQGSLALLITSCLPFIAANLTVGLMFSTLVKNQLQAMQLSFFFFLPSILLSGFMFPFHGMPQWAQTLGNILPLTHFLPVVRGILLKGNSIDEVLPELGAIGLFFITVLFIGIKRYRQTLD